MSSVASSDARKASARAPGLAARSGAKRTLDIATTSLALAFLGPLFLAVAAAVALEGAGPVLSRRRVPGLDGRAFHLLGFRTAHAVDDPAGPRGGSRGEGRPTRVGRFLRAARLDRLPRLLNVLAGDMSLVGPDPGLQPRDGRAAPADAYRDRLRTRPGVTGLAQVRGLGGEGGAPSQAIACAAADNAYIDNWSLGLDLRILLEAALSAPLRRDAR